MIKCVICFVCVDELITQKSFQSRMIDWSFFFQCPLCSIVVMQRAKLGSDKYQPLFTELIVNLVIGFTQPFKNGWEVGRQSTHSVIPSGYHCITYIINYSILFCIYIYICIIKKFLWVRIMVDLRGGPYHHITKSNGNWM